MKFLDRSESRDTRFSSFIREARSNEKKKVYNEVLKKATEEQVSTLHKARAAQAR